MGSSLETGLRPVGRSLACALVAALVSAVAVAAAELPLPAGSAAQGTAGSPEALPSGEDTPAGAMEGKGMEDFILNEGLLELDPGTGVDSMSLEGVWPQDTTPALDTTWMEPAGVGLLEPPLPVQVDPLYVRGLTGIQRGRNDSNPVWSPSGELIAFERTVKDSKEIIIATPEGYVQQKIYFQQSGGGGDLDFFLPGFLEDVSYNSGITWSPAGDRFVFMSNGGTGNYDLYLGTLGSESPTRLTEAPEKDGHAHWSPVSDKLVFVSARTGKADLFTLDLATMAVERLTEGEKTYLYPQWSPDGRKIAMIYGSNENHDIYLIDDAARPLETIRALTTWGHDDLRPVWSPDGRYVAFYSNYNRDRDPKVWSLVVVAADGSDPTEGEGLADRVVARNVNPDVERGPAWMPDSRRILYVENDRHAYFPIHVVDIRDGKSLPMATDTRINHDVTCSSSGEIAFRSQVEQWDHIFISRLEE